MITVERAGGQGPTLPYGPTKGMLQALQLMRTSTLTKVDGNFLRLNGIAPGNEYKVVGALRFLGLIDEEGKPTEKSRYLRTKGDAFTSALQGIVRDSYSKLFEHLGDSEYSRDDIYNYFVTREALGAEMATKTTRFFEQLCKVAGINLKWIAVDRGSASKGKKRPINGHHFGEGKGYALNGIEVMPQLASSSNIPLVLAVTPEMVAMDTDQLAEFFRKLRMALDMINDG